MGMAFTNHLQVITRTVSLGYAETLIQHPESMTHAIVSREDRPKHGIGDGPLRLPIGLESVEDILDDLADISMHFRLGRRRQQRASCRRRNYKYILPARSTHSGIIHRMPNSF